MVIAAGGIVSVLLAAGRGTRFDPSGLTSKLLAPAPCGAHFGEPIAVAAAHALLATVPTVIAVVRPADDPPQHRLHAQLADAGCRLVINPQADAGIGGSIAAGVGAAPDARGWLIALADMPAIEPSTIAAVAGALAQGALTAAPVCGDRRGHPVGFSAALRDRLLALQGDEGARSILADYPPQQLAVDDEGCLLDLDHATDFAPPPA